MPYKPLRKDLTQSTQQCGFCPKMLTSLKAYVLEDSVTGVLKYAGPVCAKANVGANYSLADVPDLTKYTLSHMALAHGGGSGGGWSKWWRGGFTISASARISYASRGETCNSHEYILSRIEWLLSEEQISGSNCFGS